MFPARPPAGLSAFGWPGLPRTHHQEAPCLHLRRGENPIIILDEATSALDTESEMEIQRALIRLMRHRTVVAVAHRLSTLAAFDRILVVNDGRIVEDGTVDDLRRQGGLFHRMWHLQAHGLSSDDIKNAA